MQNLPQLAANLNSFNGARFITIRNYVNSKGEVATHTVNVGTRYANSIENDLNTLKAYVPTELTVIDDFKNTVVIPAETVAQAATELINSLINNANPETKSAQSEAQSNTYTVINKALKIHNTTLEIYVWGMAVKKVTHVEGVYKPTKSNPKTLAKNKLKKLLNLSTAKYRTFIVDNIEAIAINKELVS